MNWRCRCNSFRTIASETVVSERGTGNLVYLYNEVFRSKEIPAVWHCSVVFMCCFLIVLKEEFYNKSFFFLFCNCVKILQLTIRILKIKGFLIKHKWPEDWYHKSQFLLSVTVYRALLLVLSIKQTKNLSIQVPNCLEDFLLCSSYWFCF